jgi:hypothetical protein
MKNKKLAVISIICVAVLAALAGFYFFNREKGNLSEDSSIPPSSDYKNAVYEIDGRSIVLVDGYSEMEIGPESAPKLVTKYFGNESFGDINGDGIEDKAFLLFQQSGGTGTFFYAVAAIKVDGGYLGTNGIFLGDRIAPQTTQIENGQIIINYADRNPGEPMTARPSLGVSKYLRFENGKLIEGKKDKPQSQIITDDFSIDLPEGWMQTQPAEGISAIAVNGDENISDPAVQKIGFKAYFAVATEALKGKSTGEYLLNFKEYLSANIPGIVFTKEEDLVIGGRPAHFLEMEFVQEGISFKVLSISLLGDNDDIWVVSFNSTAGNWDGYKDMFYDVANSFVLKK